MTVVAASSVEQTGSTPRPAPPTARSASYRFIRVKEVHLEMQPFPGRAEPHAQTQTPSARLVPRAAAPGPLPLGAGPGRGRRPWPDTCLPWPATPEPLGRSGSYRVLETAGRATLRGLRQEDVLAASRSAFPRLGSEV